MELEKNGVRIRNAEKADAPLLAAWWNDGAVMAHAGFPLGLGTSAEAVAAQLEGDTDDTRRRLILESDGRPVGEMSYRILADGSAEIGIKICEAAYQERGLGRAAMRLLIRALLDRGCGRIVLDTNLNNKRAQHVYELLGFRKTGVRYDSWRDQLGKMQSAVDYELTESAFRERD